MDRTERAPPTVRLALDFLLTRIGSWTHARWDQHLRSEIGDVSADAVIEWIVENLDIVPSNMRAPGSWLTPEEKRNMDLASLGPVIEKLDPVEVADHNVGDCGGPKKCEVCILENRRVEWRQGRLAGLSQAADECTAQAMALDEKPALSFEEVSQRNAYRVMADHLRRMR